MDCSLHAGTVGGKKALILVNWLLALLQLCESQKNVKISSDHPTTGQQQLIGPRSSLCAPWQTTLVEDRIRSGSKMSCAS